MKKITILIQINDQRASIIKDGKELRIFPISSSLFGLGFDEGSKKTPTGRFLIHKKIGHDAPAGTVFRERIPTGEVCSSNPRSHLWQSPDDLILSRILWLEGCDPTNLNTRDRYIYLHGTNQEHSIGKPASHGCIRFCNSDIIELFDLVDEGTEVHILE